MMELNNRIVELIKVKGKANEQAFTHCRNFFNMLRNGLRKTEQQLRSIIIPDHPSITIELEDKGRLELRFRFANDVLLFLMHTTVVTFDAQHPLMKTSYIKENPLRGLCGVIYVYNFLNDTLKYNRTGDAGELTARIFVNSENHFMMEGKRQLGILYNDLPSAAVQEEAVDHIIQQLIIHVLEVDPVITPFDARPAVSLQEIIDSSTPAAIVTGKRFGFVIPGSDDLT
jgi:hypothetical protein